MKKKTSTRPLNFNFIVRDERQKILFNTVFELITKKLVKNGKIKPYEELPKTKLIIEGMGLLLEVLQDEKNQMIEKLKSIKKDLLLDKIGILTEEM